MVQSNCRKTVRGLLIAALAGGLAMTASAADKSQANRNFNAENLTFSGVGVLHEQLGDPIEMPPVLGDRGPGCTSTACTGDINVPSTTALNGMHSDLNGAYPNSPTILADSKVAENITLGATGDITQLCWLGIYTNYPLNANPSTGTALTAPPATRTFAVSYYADAGGLPCLVPIARFFVGATNPDAGTTLSHISLTPNTRFQFTATHPAVPVTAGQCLWIEIVDIDPTLAGTFRWAGVAGAGDTRNFWYLAFPEGDNSALDFGYAPADVFTAAGDRTVCVNVGAALGASTCPGIPAGAPANDNISAPQALIIGAAPVAGTTLAATLENGVARPCGGILAASPGVWYSFVGNGNTLTVTTDFGGNDCSDPQMIVYDATAFIGSNNGSDLQCIGTGDDSVDSLNPSLTICSDPTKTYLVYIQGFDGTAASFQIAVQNGAACATPSPSQNCNIVAQMGDFLEGSTEACSLRNNDGCPGAAGNEVPLALTLGTPIYGVVENTGTTRDRDRYQITFANPTEVTVTLSAEFPALFLVWQCAGAVETALLETVVVFDTCETVPFNLLLPAGDFAFTVMPNDFSGLEDCTMTFNDYRLTVAAAATGACCTGQSCAMNTEIVCGTTANGRFLGEGEQCVVGACAAACDVVQGAATPETEACQGAALEANVVSPNGSCATAQAITGPVFGNLSTDAPGLRDIDFYSFTTTSTGDITVALESELPAQIQLVTCPSGAPASAITDVAACVRGTPVVFEDQPAGSYAIVVTSADFGGRPCNGGVNDYLLSVSTGGGPTPCEQADFNNSGNVDATDIFIFLDAWFAQNGMSGPNLSADANNSGNVDATDIFIYLDLWFANNGMIC